MNESPGTGSARPERSSSRTGPADSRHTLLPAAAASQSGRPPKKRDNISTQLTELPNCDEQFNHLANERLGLVLYTLPDGSARLQLRIQHETLWLTQAEMATVFQTSKQNISLHIKNIFVERELPPAATVKPYLTVQSEGSRTVQQLLDHYSLDVVIAVGDRVRSTRGTQFRQWATAALRAPLADRYSSIVSRISARVSRRPLSI